MGAYRVRLSQAPDTGNAEIIAHYGTPAQKERYLRPLLDGELFSSYSMTEPHAGPTHPVPTRAVRDGHDWVINGWKFFSSNARTASFLIVMVVTNPEVSPYQGMSMFLVPTDTPGVDIVETSGCTGNARTKAPTRSSTTTTSGCPPKRCSAAKARRSSSPRPGSAAGVSTTPCAPSVWPRRPST